MEEKKYVYANIKIPIEITGDSYELMNDYMTIDFDSCTELPEKTHFDNPDLVEKLFSFHDDKPQENKVEESTEEPKEELKEELKDELREEVMRILKTEKSTLPKTRKNSSFRRRGKNIKDYTRRNYS